MIQAQRMAPIKTSCMEKAARELSGVKALVVGLASTGVAASRFLTKCGAQVCAYDAKKASELAGAAGLEALGVKVFAGVDAVEAAREARLVVVSPGVPFDHPLLEEARKRGAEVISDIELAYRYMDAPVIAVAGTNGKTTTTTLIGKVLEDAGKKVFVGGNIGTPAVEYVENKGGADMVVLEISSFHLETTKRFNPHVGILLNVTEDHLDRYRDFTHYAETKFRLFENQGPDDYMVVNVNDPVIAVKAPSLGTGRLVPFSVEGELKEGVFLKDGVVRFRYGGFNESYPVDKFGLVGVHNIENIMSAIAAARLMGVSMESLSKTLASFRGLGHRMELVRELDGVKYIDDSKGTNVGAVVMALRGLEGPVVLIAGGVDKGGDYGVLGPIVKEKVKLLILIGEAREKIKNSLGGLTQTVMSGTLEEAVVIAHAKAVAGDTVLLSPACSSFDMFKSYKERGERFRASVEAL